jgi:hypothetical protein
MSSDGSSDAAAVGGDEVPRDGGTTAPPRRGLPPWLACLLAGAVAGLLAFAVGESTYGVFKARSVRQQWGPGMSDRPTIATIETAAVRNAALAYAEWGALLGLSLGLAGSLIHRSSPRGALVGLVGGAAAAAALSAAALPFVLWARRELDIDPLIVGTLSQALIWGLIAAAAGVGYGYASGGGPRMIIHYALAAMTGAAVGALIYGAIGASFYALQESDQPLAIAWQPRLLARLLPALGAAAAIGWSRPSVRGAEPRPSA